MKTRIVDRSLRRTREGILSSGLERRLASYALAASAAGVIVLGGAPPAQADSIVVQHINETLTGEGSLSFSLGVDTFYFVNHSYGRLSLGRSRVVGHQFWSYLGAYAAGPGAAFVGPPGSSIRSFGFRPLPSGGYIGPGVPSWGGERDMLYVCRYSYRGGSYPCLNGNGNGTGLIGLKFDLHGQTHYGWADVNGFSTFSVTGPNLINDFAIRLDISEVAYNRQPNAPILAGQTSNHSVPEPTTLELLALGAASLPFWRRKKSRKQ